MEAIGLWVGIVSGALGIVGAIWATIRFLIRRISASKKTEADELADKIANNLREKLALQSSEPSSPDKEIQARDQEIAQLKAAVAALIERKDELDIADALAHIEKGETARAIQIFEDTAQKREAEGDTSHKEAAEAFRHLGAIAFLNDTQRALDAYEKATSLDPENPDGWNQLGHLKDRIGDLDGAEDAYRAVLGFGEKTGDKEWIAAATGNLGTLYQTRGELEHAEEYYRKSLAIEEELGHREGMAACYGNLGNIYRTRGELERAEEHFLKSLAFYKELGRKEGMANQFGNLGNVYQIRGELERAEEHYKKALALNEELGRREGMAIQYGNLGIIYKTRGELERAEEFYRKSLAIEEELGRKEGMASDYGNLGVLYQTRGEMERAEEYYKKALTINEELGSRGAGKAWPQVTVT
jgi:tetratricopeptide (TPR) repeat protein